MHSEYPREIAVRTQFDLCDQAPLGHAVVQLAEGQENPLTNPLITEGLALIRQRLRAIQASSHPDDQAVISCIREHFLYNNDTLPAHLQGAMLRHNAVEWLTSVSDEDVLDFLRWNVDQQKVQQRRLEQDLPELKERTIAGIDRVVDFGLLPGRARALARQALACTQFIVLDSFEAAEELCRGYYFETFMGLADCHIKGIDDAWQRRYDLQCTFTHETSHGLADKGNCGLRTILPDQNQFSGWLDESMTEHIAQVAEHGEPRTVGPQWRSHSGGSYILLRYLQDILVREGAEPVSLELLGEAYVEPLDDPRLTARRELTRQLHNSFDSLLDLGGMHIVHAIARDMSLVPQVHGSSVAQKWLQRLSHAAGYVYDDVFFEERIPLDTTVVRLV